MNTKKRLISYLLILVLVLSMLPLSGCASNDFTKVLANAKQGVVQIYGGVSVNYMGYDILADAWTGSGFGVGKAGKDTNVFVTNHHVVTNSSTYDPYQTKIWILLENCTFDTITGYPDPARSIKCEVLKTTSGYPDYAIIRATTDIEGFKALPLMSSKQVEDGTTVCALGYPGDVGYISASSYSTSDITSTNGMVAQHLQFTLANDTWVLLHTAQIAHGNSGGPLIAENGAVVGINTYGLSLDADRYMAVYSDYVMEGLRDLNIDYTVYTNNSLLNLLRSGDTLLYILIALLLVAAVVVIVLLMLKKQKEEEERKAAEQRRMMEEQRRREEERRRAEERRRQEDARRRQEEEKRRQEAIKERAHLRCWDGHIAAVGAGATIGRDPSCTIRLPDNSAGVSRTHCRVEMQGGQLVVIDLGSSYGTLIHGQRIPANTPVGLKVGSTFYLGSDKFRFTVC